MRFTKEQNKVLSEIYRRLNYFHYGDLNENLLYLAYPSDARVIEKFSLIKPYGTEIPKALNWYNLTEKGKSFFSHYALKRRLSNKMNARLFDGTYTKIFNPKFLCT